MPEDLVDRAAVIAAVEEAGALAMTSWREGEVPDTRIWAKSNDSPVSDIDLAVDSLLKERLNRILPDAAWLSEETADDAARLDARLLWLVDPIDGTRDYVRGRDGWCVSHPVPTLRRRSYIAFSAPMAPHFSTMPVSKTS